MLVIRPIVALAIVAIVVAGGCASSEPEFVADKTEPLQQSEQPSDRISDAEAKVEPNPLGDAYFGELHLHAAYSLDAYGWGTRLDPDGAYRFAQGEEVGLPGGGKTKITAPLDFAAVTEHSEWLGETHMITNKDQPQYNHEFAKGARDGDENFFKTILASEDSGKRPASFSGEQGEHAYAALKSVWQEIVETTERHYQPGKFTTLHAFEWTAAPGGSNMHRNVIFRGGPDAVPDQPTSWFESRTVEELWDWMEKAGGGEENVLAIPHNANMSGGLMFKPMYSDGRAIDEDYARQRAVSEPLMEIIQAKGASESHPGFAPNDEFINFELVPLVNFVGPVENSPYMWMREGLKHGLKYEGTLGVKVVNEDNVVTFYPIQIVTAQIDGVWVTGLPETVDLITVGQGFVNDGEIVAPAAGEMN